MSDALRPRRSPCSSSLLCGALLCTLAAAPAARAAPPNAAPLLDGKRTLDPRWRTARPRSRATLSSAPRPASYAPATALLEALQGYKEPMAFVPDGGRMPKREKRAARRAYGDFVEYTQSFFKSEKPLTPAEQSALSHELVARGIAKLRADGVKFSVHYAPDERPEESTLKLELLPEGRHPLNRAAAGLAKSRDGLKLSYEPALLLARDFTAMYRGAENTVFLGNDVIQGGNLRRLPVALHELKHAHHRHDARRGVASPYYGKAAAESGALPRGLLSDYGNFQSLDEIDAYALTLRSALQLQTRRLRTGRQLKVYEQNMRKGIFDVIQLGLGLSVRTIGIARQGLALAGKPGAPVELAEKDGVVEATLLLGKPGAQYRLTVPLVQSRGVQDAQNRQLLTEQLRWTLGAASNNLTLFRVAAKVHDRVQGTKDRTEQRVLLQALGCVMNHRAVDRSPTARPLRLHEGIALFNARASALWAR